MSIMPIIPILPIMPNIPVMPIMPIITNIASKETELHLLCMSLKETEFSFPCMMSSRETEWSFLESDITHHMKHRFSAVVMDTRQIVERGKSESFVLKCQNR